ncbi:hypothetical protein [Marinobacterium arenosum]|uniref:hypothetical protein n=1 Tax=Marinobacterium arenosum TaxID=2862496 RepID=UPI001C949AF7|nr:hypothetical protein [Marinobacterium arenosum]MBY4677587.1 hypothetical protein [Marinobacterium arenosum]
MTFRLQSLISCLFALLLLAGPATSSAGFYPPPSEQGTGSLVEHTQGATGHGQQHDQMSVMQALCANDCAAQCGGILDCGCCLQGCDLCPADLFSPAAPIHYLQAGATTMPPSIRQFPLKRPPRPRF